MYFFTVNVGFIKFWMAAVLTVDNLWAHVFRLLTVDSSLYCFSFCVVYWTVVAVQRPSRWLHRRRLFFHPLNGTEHGSHPSLTTRDRELVSVLAVRIEPGDLNPRPLTRQSVTLLSLPQFVDSWQAVSACISFVDSWPKFVDSWQAVSTGI